MNSNIWELFYNKKILQRTSHHVFEIFVAAEFCFLQGAVLWERPVWSIWWMPVSTELSLIKIEGVHGWYSIQMGIFWFWMTWWFSDQELRYICTDQCEAKTLNCIVNCSSDDTTCISDCLREDTLCIEGSFQQNEILYALYIYFRLSVWDQLPRGMHGLPEPGMPVQGEYFHYFWLFGRVL